MHQKEVVLCSHRSPSSVPITKKLPVIREHVGFESILRPPPRPTPTLPSIFRDTNFASSSLVKHLSQTDTPPQPLLLLLGLRGGGREQHPSRRQVQYQRLRVTAKPGARGAFGPQTHRCRQPQALAPCVWVFTFAQTSGLNSLARRNSTLPRAKRHSLPATPRDSRSTGEQTKRGSAAQAAWEARAAPARLRALARPRPRQRWQGQPRT